MAIREEVSGPASLSKRTDLNTSRQGAKYMAGGSYGEGQELMEMQNAAPMAGSQRRVSMPPVTGLEAPTERPDEPDTMGMSFGPGLGPEILGLPQKTMSRPSEVLQRIAQFDDSDDTQELMKFLQNRGL